MAERIIYWRDKESPAHIEWAYEIAHKGTVASRDASPAWERVHVLSDVELAARDGEAAERIAQALRDAANARFERLGSTDPGYAELERDAHIAREEGSR